ncbi:MAG TPA: hypothetical protein VH087_20940, partial [Thermoanaerobaculia bacterium]|nr:hypothetical protein [Thermoanaerobaculia bacterium]
TPEVEREIVTNAPTTEDPLNPEVAPLQWLRRFSNYLTPKLGLTSGDTWAFAGSYVRNLLLVWLMFVPFLAAILAIPRLAIALLHRELETSGAPEVTAAIAAVLILIGTLVVAVSRPVTYRTSGWLTNARFQLLVLLPYALAAVLLVDFWAARYRTFDNWGIVVGGFIAIGLFSSLLYMWRFWRASLYERATNVRSGTTKEGYVAKKSVNETIAAVLSALVSGGLLYSASWFFREPVPHVIVPDITAWQAIPPHLSNAPGEIYLCFAVPLVLGILFVQSAIFVGISSWFNEEYDREWWGRAAGWVLLTALGWVAGTAIAVYGPVAIYYAPRLYAGMTAVTGVISVLLGRSGKTSANAKEQSESANSTAETGTNVTLGLLAPIFALCILALISLATSLVVISLAPPSRINPDQLAQALSGTYSINLNKTFPAQLKLPDGWSFHASGLPAADQVRIHVIEHLWAVDSTNIVVGLILVIGLTLFSLFVAYFIGANQVSMHGLYRNRLIRCYLGASRFRGGKSTTNAFSGFDPSDNMPMHRLRPELFWGSTFIDVVRDGPAIISDVQLASYIHWATEDAIAKAAKAQGDGDPDAVQLLREACDILADDLNHALDDLTLEEPGPHEPQSIANRRVLDARFPGAFRPWEPHVRPMHLVGMTLNLVESENLAWQERKASSFTVSPLYTGNFRLGYRPTRAFGGPSGVSLGTAVAISGAAVSPNMGYNSSPALSFLLTLFNVRLGWWYGNPAKKTYSLENPRNTLITILDEALGRTTDANPFIYLSDGGHFDNLGLYESVLRRCRCIVVTDCASDASFGFADLGNAIRKIRIDFGIDVEMGPMQLFPRSTKNPKETPKYCAIGNIRYSAVDGDGAKDGKLVYIKAAYYGTEPRDVCAYADMYPTFPHQSTGNQWYSESQFEAYRQLGYHTLDQIAQPKEAFGNVCELVAQAEEYVKSSADSRTGTGMKFI